jgi:threonine dehydrogenase-like Zn-dependent dehydrogenase
VRSERDAPDALTTLADDPLDKDPDVHRLDQRDRGASATLASDAVLKNLVLFGSVNANRRHYYRAARVLGRADRSWLEQLVTRRVGPEQYEQALEREPDDIKVVIEFAQP